jgi:hypothetical protein
MGPFSAQRVFRYGRRDVTEDILLDDPQLYSWRAIEDLFCQPAH